MKLVICNYCGKRAILTYGSALFPLHEKLQEKLFWTCAPCKAHVGCHPGTDKPLGTLARHDLRLLRHSVHLSFDQKWKRGRHKKSRRKRTAAYTWLASELGIPVEQCHIGMFDKKMCEKALEVLKG